MFFSLLISSQALALEEVTAFSFEDDFKVEKVVMGHEIFLNDLTKLHPNLGTENERMMAGEFEKKKDLRSKLDESKESMRF